MPVMPQWCRQLSWQALLVSLAAGGIIHIVATLVIPQFATASGVKRVSSKLPLNRMQVMPRMTAETQILPYAGPDMRLAICRFDVSNGPIDVSAVLPDKGWSLAIYTMQGDNFYVVPAPDFRRGEVNFQLIPPAEKVLGIFSIGRIVEASASHIPVAQAQGLIVVRAPIRGRAYQADVEAYLQQAQCGTGRG